MKRGRKFLLVAIAAICLVCSSLLVACKKDNTPNITPPPPPLTISQSTVTLDMHEQVQLSVEETGDTTWTSGDNAVCTVDANGLVKSVGVGVTTVTATQGDRNAKCTVTVENTRTAAQIELADGATKIGVQTVRAINDTFTLNASVMYKNNTVADDVGELQWSVDHTSIATLTPAADKKSASVTCNTYGTTVVRVSTTVWGEPISKSVELIVRNTNVSFTSSAVSLDEDNIGKVEMYALDTTNTAKSATKSLDVTCMDSTSDVTNSVTWSVDPAGVVTVSGGVLTAVKAGTATVTGAYQGNTVTVNVTVNKNEIEIQNGVNVSLWDKVEGQNTNGLLNAYPTQAACEEMRARTVTVTLPDAIKGTVEACNMCYSQPVGNTTETVTRDIMQGSADGLKITVRPSYYSFNMGWKAAEIVTDKAKYTIPFFICTMKISDKDELDAFRYYTTYQNDWKETTTAGTYAPILWDGYFVLDNNITYNVSTEENFAKCKKGSLTRADWDAINAYLSFINSKDMIKFAPNKTVDAVTKPDLDGTLSGNYSSTIGDFGFCGVFDGNGYNVQGLYIVNKAGAGDDWTGDMHDEGGFIGMLTAHTFGAETVYGTIRNISFTDVLHGELKADESNGLGGSYGGFLFSVAHGAVVENINIEVALRGETYALLGGSDWHMQLPHASKIRNVMISVAADRVKRVSNNEVWADGYGFSMAYYDQTVVQNLYIVLGKIWEADDNFWGHAMGCKADQSYGCKYVDNNIAKVSTAPVKAFAAFTDSEFGDGFTETTHGVSLAKYLIDTEHAKENWDTDYWNFPNEGEKAGTPVFKTKA